MMGATMMISSRLERNEMTMQKSQCLFTLMEEVICSHSWQYFISHLRTVREVTVMTRRWQSWRLATA